MELISFVIDYAIKPAARARSETTAAAQKKAS
jgi:hypothetical protein